MNIEQLTVSNSYLQTECVPRLAFGVRLKILPGDGEVVLLLPEYALRLKGASAEILSRCDGQKSILQIIREMEETHSNHTENQIATDVQTFIKRMIDKGAIRL